MFLAIPENTDTIGSLLDLGPGGSVDILADIGSSALYMTIAGQRWDQARVLLSMGADPHLPCVRSHKSARSETPTSIAMCSSWTFWSFRNILREANIDVEYYIQSGLGRAGPLIDDGWHVETLRLLFQYDFEPDPVGRRDYVWKCSHGDDDESCRMVGVEPVWHRILERIKCGIDVDALSSNASNAGIQLAKAASPMRASHLIATLGTMTNYVLIFPHLDPRQRR